MLLEFDRRLVNARNMPEDFVESRAAVIGEDETPLHLAAEHGHVDCMRALMDAGANLNAVNIMGDTPLHYAAEHNQCDAIGLLLRRGAEAKRLNSAGISPLVSAAQSGKVAAARLLWPYDHATMPLLQYAALTDDVATVRSMLRRRPGAVNNRAHGFAALHYAAIAGSIDAARELLKAHASTGLEAKDQRTAVYLASQWGHVRLLALLLSEAKHSSIIIARRYTNGETALHAAAENGNVVAVRLLLNAGAAVAARDYEGYTPLHYAAMKGADSVVTALLAAGADPNARGCGNRTPLHEVSVNVVADQGPQEGHLLATPQAQVAAARVLLAAGADPQLVDDSGISAIAFARRQGRQDIALLLDAHLRRRR